jgi:SAM-dependent methyltransferase
MSFDAEAYRQASLEGWEAAAGGWTRHAAELSAWSAPVTHAMIEAAAPQLGERVLELAAGLGETAMLAAELVAPLGTVVVSDQAETMLAAARERAAELGVGNVEFAVLNAEWIDLPLASVDVVLCRFGYMLMADPETALGESRRVLRPGGRVALAVWDAIDANPWAALPALVLSERGLAPASDGPGPFSLGDAAALRELLEQAGFTEIEILPVEIARRHPGFEDFWELTLDLSRSFHDAVLSRPQAEVEQIEATLAERVRPFEDGAGALTLPGRALVALASA